jgi:hypothetical protein
VKPYQGVVDDSVGLPASSAQHQEISTPLQLARESIKETEKLTPGVTDQERAVANN